MDSPGKTNPLALGLVRQEAWSSPQGRAYTPSAMSTPESANSSIRSTTLLANYGADMNRDFAVITLLEDKLGREVEHEELRAAIANFALVHGQLPSIRQLALELANHHADGASSARDVPESPTAHSSPLHSPLDDDASPEAALRDEPIFFGPLRALRCNGTHLGLLSHDPLARLHSPGSYPPPSRSRFCRLDGSPAHRTPLGSRRHLEPQWQQRSQQHPAAEPPKQPLLPSLLGMEPLSFSAPDDEDDDVAGPAADLSNLQPAPRPFVPGLNLRGLKKKPQPTLQAGASPPTATGSPAPLLKAPGVTGSAGGGSSSSGHGTPDSCSPTEILRMLLPSACKPRPSLAAGAPSRLWAAQSHAGSAVPSERAGTERAAAGAAVAGPGFTAGEAELDSGDVRRLGCLRVSMDDLDQRTTGLRRDTPLKALPPPTAPAVDRPDVTLDMARAKTLPASGPFSSSAHEKQQQQQQRATPGSRGRRLDMQDQGDQDVTDGGAASRNAAAPAAGVASASAKRQLRLLPLEQQLPGAGGDRDDCPAADSDVRKGTSSMAAAAATGTAASGITAAAAAAATVTNTTCTAVGDAVVTVRCSSRPTAAADGGSEAQQQQPSQGPSPVPPLRLPGASSGVPAQPRPSARHRACPAAPSARVPPLALGGGGQQQQGHGRGQLPAAGARTRRLSICLPSAMVYGEGPLTTRRMAAGANTGVTSHALCTVFWAESEDELDLQYDDDTESYDMDEIDEEEEDEYGIEYDMLGHHDDPVAAAAVTQDLIAAAAAAVAAKPPLSPLVPARGGGGGGGRHRDRRGRGRGRRWRQGDDEGAGQEADPERCGGGLMLPEQLWDAWERLSDGPKGRQYRLLESLTHVERITCTSYSTVSKACHQGQPVVVKIYDVAERDKLANAFAEIGVLLHLDGWPGAVRLLDFGRHEDKVMLMLERCDVSLKDWCDNTRFETATGADYILECLRMWQTLAELLTQLHERWHVAHCDLKPGNVLLSGGRLVLADFSESMLFNENPILQDQARGTVPYQPPEMVHGHCVDARKADVWAMGCILYELITGELMFRGNNDCMRAVTARGARRRTAAGRGGARQRQPQQRAGDRGSAAAKPQPQQQHWDIIRSCPEQAALALWEQGGGAAGMEAPAATTVDDGDDAVAMAAAAMPPPPRVPRLPLALTRGSAGGVVASSGSPWRGEGQVPSSSAGGAGALSLFPSQFFMAAAGGAMGVGGGSALGTGRSLELIAEGGCGAEVDAASLASTDQWVVPMSGRLHTAPTTARSTARSAQMPYPYHHYYYAAAGHDTARSVASTSTTAAGAAGAGAPGSSRVAGCWPPAPPPSAGTARSVADSEWALAMPPTATAATTTTGAGCGYGASAVASARSCAGGAVAAGPSSNRSAAAAPYTTASVGGDDGSHPPPPPPPVLLPPHRRLRHSVSTQCSDPAGPDWLTTEEADRLRIMCDEPPSFVLVHYHGGGSDTARGVPPVSGPPSSGRGDGGSGGSSSGGSDGGMATVAETLRDLYEPRRLSGADGPTLGDDVLGLLRTVLVEDRVRPSMRQVAAMAAEALARHCPPPAPSPSLPPLSGEASEESSTFASAAAPPEDDDGASAGNVRRPHRLLDSSTSNALAAEGLSSQRLQAGLLNDRGEPSFDSVVAIVGGATLAAAAQGAWYYGAEAPAAGAAGGDACGDDQGAPTAAAAAFALPPRLCLSVLQERPSSCYDGGSSSLDGGAAAATVAGAFGGGWGGPLTVGTDGGASWADSISLGGDVMDTAAAAAAVDTLGGISGGGGAPVFAAAAASGSAEAGDDSEGGQVVEQGLGKMPRPSVSLFDVCQPLVTSRGPMPFSRSWQRFLTRQQEQ